VRHVAYEYMPEIRNAYKIVVKYVKGRQASIKG
jgi:hypothetical protein